MTIKTYSLGLIVVKFTDVLVTTFSFTAQTPAALYTEKQELKIKLIIPPTPVDLL
jgi:hypothetical protein